MKNMLKIVHALRSHASLHIAHLQSLIWIPRDGFLDSLRRLVERQAVTLWDVTGRPMKVIDWRTVAYITRPRPYREYRLRCQDQRCRLTK